MRRQYSINGFTLIELVVVVLILGVMIALVAPTFGEIGAANLKRSTRRISGMIRFLRDDALAKKAVYRLSFDIQNGRYWAERLAVTSEQTAEFKSFQSSLAGEGGLFGQTAFREVSVAGHPDEPYILFTPDGWVESAFIHLRDGGGRDYTLIVNPLTGKTELVEGYVEEK